MARPGIVWRANSAEAKAAMGQRSVAGGINQRLDFPAILPNRADFDRSGSDPAASWKMMQSCAVRHVASAMTFPGVSMVQAAASLTA
jgi:hypothetical protein